MPHILIVDDDVAFVRQCEAELARRRVEHSSAGSTDTGVAKLETTRITGAIVKLQLPDPSRRLWRTLEQKGIAAAAVSDVKQEAGAAEKCALDLGTFVYVEKPVNVSVLITAILAAPKRSARPVAATSSGPTVPSVEGIDGNATVLDVKLSDLNAAKPAADAADLGSTVPEAKLSDLKAAPPAVAPQGAKPVATAAPSTAKTPAATAPPKVPTAAGPLKMPAAPTTSQAPKAKPAPWLQSPQQESAVPKDAPAAAAPAARGPEAPKVPPAKQPPSVEVKARDLQATPAPAPAPSAPKPSQAKRPASVEVAPVSEPAKKPPISRPVPAPRSAVPAGSRGLYEADAEVPQPEPDPTLPPVQVSAEGSGNRLAILWTVVIVGALIALFARRVLSDTPEERLQKIHEQIEAQHKGATPARPQGPLPTIDIRGR